MPGQDSVFITAAVEGNVDEAVVWRLIEHVGGTPGPVYGRNGKNHLRQRVSNYNQAARLSPWIILVDLDHDAECAPPLRGEWLAEPVTLHVFSRGGATSGVVAFSRQGASCEISICQYI